MGFRVAPDQYNFSYQTIFLAVFRRGIPSYPIHETPTTCTMCTVRIDAGRPVDDEHVHDHMCHARVRHVDGVVPMAKRCVEIVTSRTVS
jgi:hypothetical protein